MAPPRVEIAPDVEFAFEVFDQADQHILVTVDEHTVEYSARMHLTYDGGSLNLALGEEAHNVQHALYIELARFGVGFEVALENDEIILHSLIPRDNSLNQFVFTKEIFFLRRAMILATQVIQSEMHRIKGVPNSEGEHDHL